MLKSIWIQIVTFFKRLLTAIVGQVSWQAPTWLIALKTRAAARPKALFGGLLAFLALFVVMLAAYHWYQSRPQPERVIADITVPKITPNDKILVPDDLSLNFGVRQADELHPRSVAPLSQVGKEVSEGVSIHPDIAGVWQWDTDHHLVFTPSSDWLPDQTYTIDFAPNFFTSKANLASLHYTFKTKAFTATIAEFKFYQDPINPQLKQAVATIDFNYPVDAASLQKHLTLQYQALKNGLIDDEKPVTYTINYDEHKRQAFLRTGALQLPRTERFLELTIAKGLKAGTGDASTLAEVKSTVLIPDAGSYFKVTNVTAAIVRNEKDKPQQILTLETTTGVTEKELAKSLHVYVLPQDYPASATEPVKLNYQWQNPGEVTPAILALAKPVSLRALPTDRDDAVLHSYQFNATAPGFLYVKLDKGIQSFGEFTLTNDYSNIVAVPAYPQEITFLHKGAIIALGTDERLSVLVRGLNTVKFNFARVLPNDLNHLITQTAGDFNNPYFLDPSTFSRDNITEIASEFQDFDVADPAAAQYTALNLGRYFHASTNGLGLFLLQAQAWDKQNNIALSAEANRLVLITDLGLIVKDNADSTHDVFVQSITGGTPVANANVSILGKNGLALLTQKTDINGHTSFPSLTDFINEKEPVVYLVKNGNDVSFIPYNRPDRLLNYSRFDVGGVVNNDANQTPLTAFIFSDRGIYRPGDTAHIGMIIKRPFAQSEPAGLPLQVIVTDPRGVNIKDEKMTLNAAGFLSLELNTQSTSPTGQYNIALYIVKDNHASSLIGSATINVAEFLPDRMRITTKLSSPQTQGWLSPDELKAQVNLWNLYGAPAADRKVSGKILLSPLTVHFKEYADYTFIDPLLNPKSPPKVFTDDLTDTRTNQKGEAEFDLKLNRFEKATYQLTFFAEGFEADGGRSVAAQTSMLVSPLDYFVGYKADGDLNYLKQNGTRTVHFIAINPQLQQQALSDLHLITYQQHPVSTLIKKEDGTYQYQSIIQTTEINNQAFSIAATGTDFTLPAQNIGDYLVVVTDANGTQLSRFNYSVVGASAQALPKNAELSVKLNKTEFAPNEDIEMQLTAPYTGAGLITIERDKVYAYQWFKTNTNTSVQKIRLPQNFQGGGYINVTFVRDLNSPEIFMSPLSFSVVPFSVSHDNAKIKVSLTAPALARPGTDLPITYATDKPSKIVVFGVDEGILQVSRYTTPDPLQFFFQKRALQVSTQQIVDQILPKFVADRELSAAGGDAGEAALNKHLNPFKRKTDLPVVFWSQIVDADSSPKQFTYHVPDYFNGTLRIMAVAVADSAVGSSAATTTVRGYFVINPNVPTFVAPGDEFDVSASVANNVEGSGDNATVNVQLNTSAALKTAGNTALTLTIPEGQERTVHFKLRAGDIPQAAELNIMAKIGDKVSNMSATLSVRPASVFTSYLTSGYTTDASKTLALNYHFYDAYRSQQVMASSSPFILLSGLQRYLNEYPYGCTEQLVSKGFPLVAMTNQPGYLADAARLKDKVEQTIQAISSRQLSSGAFNYWPDGGLPASNDFASVYAMHFLTEAKVNGYAVPNDVFTAGIGFLKDFVTQEVTNLEQARLHAYAIYVLTRNEIVTTNYLTNLQLTLDQHPDYAWQQDITCVYLASTYQLLKNNSEGARLLKLYQPAKSNHGDDAYDFYNHDIANALYLYLVAKHFPDYLSQVNQSFVLGMVETLNSDSLSTVLSSYSSLALAAFAQAITVENNASLTLTEVNLAGKENLLSSTSGNFQEAPLAAQATKVIIKNPDKKAYFYQLAQAGFNRDLPVKEQQQGIEAFREYRDESKNVVSAVPLGDEIVVHIKARTTDQSYRDNIAIVDLLPGGFEVVRESIKNDNMDYIDVREDRVIFFGSLAPESKEITYRIKATNAGQFIVPPFFATSMYNANVKSIGVGGHIEVKAVE